MSAHEAALMALIDDALAGRLDFEEFSSGYHDYYLWVLPPLALSEGQSAFYFAVYDRLDWTAVEVDEESRRDGRISAAEFLIWLRFHRDGARGDAAYRPPVDQLFERIRAACPSFVAVDDEAATDWQDEDHRLHYVRIAGLARHLAQLAEAGLMDLIVPVLDLADEALVGTDGYTRELVAVGLFEDLQGDLLRTKGRVRLVDIRAQLRPTSRATWDLVMTGRYGSDEKARTRLPPGSLPDE